VHPAKHRVPHRPAHEGQIVARGSESGAQLVDHRCDPVELCLEPLLHLGDQQGRQRVGHGTKL
jgi:hypothetical protein